MARPYCVRCCTEVILDSDGQSCPNCHAVLIPNQPPTAPQTPTKAATTTARRHTRRATADVKAQDKERSEHSLAVTAANQRRDAV